jgi:hypothetical protein
LMIIFRAPPSPHFLSSAPSSPWPYKVVRFLTLPPFSRASLSPYLLLSAPSSPHLFRARLWALAFLFEGDFKPSHFLKHACEPSLPIEPAFEPSHFLKHVFEPSLSFERAFEPSTILLSAPSSLHFPFSFFYLSRSPLTMRSFIYIYIYIYIYIFYLVRSPITMRPVSLYLSKKKIFVLFFIGQVTWNN